MLLWICLALFFMYFVCYEIWWGLTRYKKIILAITQGDMPKTRLYVRFMLGLWIPAGLVFLLLLTGQLAWHDLGLSWFRLRGQSWLFYILAVTAILYFLYLIYSLIVLRIYALRNVSINQKMSDEVKALIPATKKEKQIWIFTAITAGITEEVLFRGFLFYLLAELFPGFDTFLIAVISALVFGIGHLYQGLLETVKAIFMGLIFGLFYIAFSTIIPCIVLHMMQDLCAVYMINESCSSE